jgi:hypothetical protein
MAVVRRDTYGSSPGITVGRDERRASRSKGGPAPAYPGIAGAKPRAVGACRLPAAGSATTTGQLPPEVEVAEQSQVPEDPDADPREAGFGPGERGDSIEEGRQGKEGEQGGGEQEDDDAGEG